MNRTLLRYIVTAGGTREPIDEVRYLGNVSTGRLGACIADRAAARGHEVVFLHGAGAVLPDRREEMVLVPFVTSAELEAALERAVTAARPPGVVIHAAAVADYIPERRPGKIPSRGEELVIRLRRAKKIVDSIKAWNPRLFLVKFKLEVNRTREELLAAGRDALRPSRADWVVANDLRGIGETRHQALSIRADDEVAAE